MPILAGRFLGSLLPVFVLLLSAGSAEPGDPAEPTRAQTQQRSVRVFDPAGFSLELAWKKSLGSGYSRIAGVDGLAVTMFSDGEFDHLIALDAATGEEIWRYRIATTYRGHDGSQDGPISTPVIDAGVVYALGPKGHLFAVSLADGRPIWTRQIEPDADARPPLWGFATTPLIAGEVLVVQTGGGRGKSVTGFRKQTGEILWSVGDDRVGYQSPAIGTPAGQRQVVAVGGQQMMGIRPDAGEILWSFQHGARGGEGSEVPVFVGEDRVLVRFHGDGGGRYASSDVALYQISRREGGFAVQRIAPC